MANLFLDIASGAVVSDSLSPAAIASTATGSAVDLVQSNGNMSVALLEVGTITGSAIAIDVKIQESNSSASGFQDIPGATFSQVTTSGVAGASGAQIRAFQRQKRYCRAIAAATGITSATLGVSIFGPAAEQPPDTGGWDTDPSSMPGAPTLTSVTVSADGVTVTMIWSQPVFWRGLGTGSVISPLGGGALTYSSGSGSATLVFTVPTIIQSSEVAVLALDARAVQAVSTSNPNAVISNRIVTNNGTESPATLSTATIGTNGTTLTLVFSSLVSGFASGAEGFAMTALTGGATTLAYASGEGTATIAMTINRTVSGTETGGKLAYTPGDIITVSNSLAVAAFSGTNVTNNSTQP